MIRIRDLLDRIEVVPGEEPRSVKITVRADRNALISLAIVTDFELTLGEPILRRFACTRENGEIDGG